MIRSVQVSISHLSRCCPKPSNCSRLAAPATLRATDAWSPREHTAGGGPTTPPAVVNPVVATAVALTEGAALAAAVGAVASWNPLAYLDVAAGRAWAAAGGDDKQDWRTCASRDGAELRAAVLLAEAAISRSLADGGYLSARQLSIDLRHAADWLAAGARFDR
jgi:hypothetical protein